MKELVKHIENLLPEHDCVVVPGLGGFVQNEIQALIKPGARLFYPASKEIGFNPRLKFNDGLLAQSFQEANGLNFDEANAEIQKSVQGIQEKLEAGKFIRLGRTGTLFMIDQQMIFRPDHHNHFYSEAYGLTPFTFPLLNQAIASSENTPIDESKTVDFSQNEKTASRERNSSRDEFIHIRFSRSRVRQLIAAVAVFLFLILMAKPAGLPAGSQEASMLHTYLSAPSPIVQKTTTNLDSTNSSIKKDSLTSKNDVSPTPSVPEIQKAPIVEAPTTETLGSIQRYYIVVSTFVQKSTAQRWLSEHESEDILKDAGIIAVNGRARVYVKSYVDKEEASAFLNKFTSTHTEYASAWVYSSKID